MNPSTPSLEDPLKKPSNVASAVGSDPLFFTGMVNAQFGSGHHSYSEASLSAQSAESAAAPVAP